MWYRGKVENLQSRWTARRSMFTASFYVPNEEKMLSYRSNLSFLSFFSMTEMEQEQTADYWTTYFGIQFIVFTLRCRLSGAIWVRLTWGAIAPQVAYISKTERTEVKTFLLRKVEAQSQFPSLGPTPCTSCPYTTFPSENTLFEGPFRGEETTTP